MIFFQGARCKTSFFFLAPKGSLFSLYYFHSYNPAYLEWNLFLTTHYDKFYFEKHYYPYFFTPIIPTCSSLLFPSVYRYFPPVIYSIKIQKFFLSRSLSQILKHINYIFKHYFDQCRIRRNIGIFKFILMNDLNE